MKTMTQRWWHWLRSIRQRARVQCGTRRVYRHLHLERLEPRLALAAHDTLATAIPLPLNASQQAQVPGTLLYANQVDLYAVQVPAGDLLTATVSDQSAGQAGSTLRLFDSTGQQLASQWPFNDPLSYAASTAGVYYVGVSSGLNTDYDPNTSGSGSGGSGTGSYTLSVGLTPFQLHDTLATAIPLPLNASQQAHVPGTLLYANQVDLYAVQVPAGDLLSATVSDQSAGQPGSTLRLFDSTGQQLASQSPFNDTLTDTLGYVASNAGAYYVGVSSWPNISYDPNTSGSGSGGSGTGSYTLSVGLTPFQLHDTLATAIPLPLNASQQAHVPGTLLYANQVDLYAVQVPAGDLLTASVSDQSAGQPGSTLRLFDSTGQQLASQSPFNGYAASTAGVYYVGVSSGLNTDYDPNTSGSGSGGSGTGSYTLSVGLTPFQPHDTLTTAIPLPLNASQQAQVPGTLLYASQVDLYAFPVAANNLLTVDVTDQSPRQPGSSLVVFDSTGQEVASQFNNGNLETTLSFAALNAGVYYVGVSSGLNIYYDPNTSGNGSNGSGTGSYTLSVGLTPFQLHDTLTTAMPLPLNTGQQAQVPGTLLYANQVELYAVQVPADNLLTATVSDQIAGQPASTLRIFDSTGKPLATQWPSNDPLSYVPLNAGLYYVGVSSGFNISYDPNTSASGSNGSGTGSYTLSVSLQVVERHDTLATAIPLPLNANQQAQVPATLLYANQVDLYAVQVPAGDLLSATVSDQSADQPGSTLRIFDSTGQQLASQSPFNDTLVNDTLGYVASNAGVYYVGVSSGLNTDYDPNTSGSGSDSGALGTGSYTLSVSLTALQLHDTLTTAIPVTLNSNGPVQLPGTLAYADQVELYSVTAPVDDLLIVDIADQSAGQPGSSLRIFDSAGQQVAVQRNFIELDTNSLTFPVFSPGVYYVGVSSGINTSYDPNTSGSGSDGSAAGSYVLSVGLVTFQPHDRLGTAVPLAVNTSKPIQVTGAITYTNQVDLYSVNVPADNVLLVNVSNQSDTGPASSLRIFDRFGTEVASQFNSGNLGTTLSIAALNAGLYYVGVSSGDNLNYDPTTSGSGSNGSATGPYILSISLTPLQLHDTLTTALPLPLNASQQAQVPGTLLYANQVQLYAVQVPADALLSANVGDQSAGQPQSTLRLFDSTGQQLASQWPFNDPLSYLALNAGVYYVGVSSGFNISYDPTTSESGRNGSGTGSYTLSVSLTALQLHDTPTTAIPLLLNANQQAQVTGTLLYSNQVDFYAVQVPADTLLSATASDQAAGQPGSTLSLFDSTSQEVASQFNYGNLETTLSFAALNAGIYYIGVSSSNGSGTGSYTLSVSLQPIELHDTLATAIPLPLNASQQAQVPGTLLYANQVDLYAVQVPADDLLSTTVSDQIAGEPANTLRIFDSTGQPLATQWPSNGPLSYVALNAGLYYVGVSSGFNIAYDPNTSASDSNGSGTGSYTLSVSLQPIELHDTLTTALPLPLNAKEL